MKKRVISLLLVFCIVISITPMALGAMSLSNFSRIRTYRNNFTDVPQSAWFFDSVKSAFEYGIMDGKAAGVFDPNGRITIAETVKIAAMMHRGYHTGSMDFPEGSPWYLPYFDYARANGIPVSSFRNLNAAATRADFALIVSGAFPDEAMTPKNSIADGAVPDVFESFSYGKAVYRLYRAGVLSGSDSAGRFFPGRTLSRAEAATIIMRAVDADARVSISLGVVLSGEEIYRQASPAVFFIEVLDSEGTRMKTGSGFFISSSGIAVTNYHVLVGGHTAKVTLHDGTVMDIEGVYDFNWKKDSAIIQISGSSFPYLELADSSKLQTGATVYALGSPLGLHASFSRGIVSQTLRRIEGMDFIQLDAAISSGSSGGALLDASGRAVGVTAATMRNAQNINLAIPMNFFSELSQDRHVPLSALIINVPHYANFYPAPDFGAYNDVRPFDSEVGRDRAVFSYRISDLDGTAEELMDAYEHLLWQNLFEHSGNLIAGASGEVSKIFTTSRSEVRLILGTRVIRGHECIVVTLTL